MPAKTVVVLDNLTTGFDWAIDHRATLVQGNAGDIELVGKADRRASASPRSSISPARSWCRNRSTDPLKYYANNTATSRNLIEAAVKGGVKHFIFSSTAAVYGMTGLDAGGRRHAAQADVALWPLQADDRVDAGRRRRGASAHLWRAALFQRRRRRSARSAPASRRRPPPT